MVTLLSMMVVKDKMTDVLTAYCDKCLSPFWQDHNKSFLCPKCIEEE